MQADVLERETLARAAGYARRPLDVDAGRTIASEQNA